MTVRLLFCYNPYILTYGEVMVILFNSWQFLLFFPVVTALYFVIPVKLKPIWLLFVSWFFYACWNIEHLPLLLTVTLITYLCGRLLERCKTAETTARDKKNLKKFILFSGIFSDLAILFYFKYTGFAAELLKMLFAAAGKTLSLPEFDILLPVGISFYTFQAIGYTVDVYRDDIKAEKNLLHYALFVSFFPQLVAGPIERSGKLLAQLKETKKYDHDRTREGLLVMLWGYFLKLVIADRAAVFVDTVYTSYAGFPGSMLLIATILFAVQIYCDFAGYSTIAAGAAEILGLKLTDNFEAPYLSASVADFWKRWHVSLTSWFRDYVYIPLGGNRKGKIRKQLNILIVFLLSGLWHGADLTFIVWGGINGIYRVFGEITRRERDRIAEALHINKRSVPHRIAGGIITFALIDLTWIFFRAPDITVAGNILSSVFGRFELSSLSDDALLRGGLDAPELIILFFSVLILLIVDICKQTGHFIPRKVSFLPFPARSLIIVFSVCFILLFGVWGSEYNASNFIYFRF